MVQRRGRITIKYISRTLEKKAKQDTSVMKKTKRRREESVWWGTIKLVQSKKKHLECNIEIQRHYNQSKYSRTWNSLLSSLRSKKYSKVQHLENPLTVVRKHMGILLRRNEHSHTLPKKTECRWELMQPAMMISSNHRATPERVVLQSLPRSPTADKMTLRHTRALLREVQCDSHSHRQSNWWKSDRHTIRQPRAEWDLPQNGKTSEMKVSPAKDCLLSLHHCFPRSVYSSTSSCVHKYAAGQSSLKLACMPQIICDLYAAPRLLFI